MLSPRASVDSGIKKGLAFGVSLALERFAYAYGLTAGRRRRTVAVLALKYQGF